MDPKLLKSRELDEADALSLRTNSMLTAMEASLVQKNFDKACKNEAAAVDAHQLKLVATPG